ncbi:IS3 family transposase [Alicyclobacillus sp. ALC3]|uniref:IS3 family transposase n=1 Tax=Alicyclobacillus sp. ALC3 TaxID=2796143 RepID=UPI0023781AB3|nr:IS3 family transposase [Alicyclobacillus sp. ALC3]
MLKRELVHLKKFETREQAMKRIFEYIEVWYNRVRIHASTAYLSPVEYEYTYFQAFREHVS